MIIILKADHLKLKYKDYFDDIVCMVIITIGHDLMAQALELFCRRCWLLSPAGSRERKCGTGLWCVAAAALAGEDDVDNMSHCSLHGIT